MIDTLHLFVTKKCTNNCPLCCNNNYIIEDIPIVKEEELSTVNTVFLTGGEPFILGDKLDEIIKTLRTRDNIKNIYVYTSGLECYEYLNKFGNLPNIDGINFSPKSTKDWGALIRICQEWKEDIERLESNRLYVFLNRHDDYTFTIDDSYLDVVSKYHFEVGCNVFLRIWTNSIESRPNEIFRRLENYD